MATKIELALPTETFDAGQGERLSHSKGRQQSAWLSPQEPEPQPQPEDPLSDDDVRNEFPQPQETPHSDVDRKPPLIRSSTKSIVAPEDREG